MMVPEKGSTDRNESGSAFSYPAWQQGEKGQRWRFIILCILTVELVVILCGWHFQQHALAQTLQQFLSVAAVNVIYEIVSESWLDSARMKVLQGRSTTNQKILEPQLHRESFHSRNRANGTIPGLPYLGPQNWHYETSACIRDVILSNTMIILFFAAQEVFSVWWISIILATYLSDMLFLLSRWSFVTSGWLHFVSLHHIFSTAFLTVTSWRPYMTIQGPFLRAIALVWFSNQFTTFPIIYRSFTGTERKWMVIFGVVCQRIIRWSAALAAIIELAGIPSQTYFLAGGSVALLFLETLDIRSQLKKIRSLLKPEEDDNESVGTSSSDDLESDESV